jgi:hypothetical protein
MRQRQLLFFGFSILLAGYAATAAKAEQLQQQGRQIFASVPLVFEENRGQADRQFQYLSHTDGDTLLLGKSEAVLGSGLHMRWVGANRDSRATGEDRLAATSNYFFGSDRSRWMTGIANYRQVQYRQLYPGIDVIYYGNQRQLEYDLHIAPGIDPRHAELAFDDAASVRVDSLSGDLLVASSGRTTRWHKPVAYQRLGDENRRGIQVSYSVQPDHHVRFKVGRYDHHRDLVIDPSVTYGTYFAGASSASANSYMVFLGIGTDANGDIYVAGYQANPALPTTPGSYQPNCLSDPAKPPQNCLDYFIAKFDPSQSGANSLIYTTFIGTSGGVNPVQSPYYYNREFAVDSAGNAYLAGVTDDAGYPTTANAYEPHCYQAPGTPTPALCARDISFLTKLNPSGSALLYSTYFGDPDFPSTYVMAVDDSGRAFVAGTDAGNGVLPVTNGAPCPIDSADGICQGNFVGAFDTTQSGNASLIYLEYIALFPTGLATDGHGNAYLYGEVQPLSPPTYTVPNGYQTVSDGGGSNTLLQKFNLSGTITYGTFFQATTPGAANVHAGGVAADASGRAFITGYGNSESGNQNLPNLNGLPEPVLPSCCTYLYLGAIDTTQSGAASLLYGTKILPSTLPANVEIIAYAFSVATDGAGKVLIAAQTGPGVQPSNSSSPVYPIVNPLPNAAPGLQSAALTLIDTTQSGSASLVFSSPIDGSGNEPMQVSIDAADNLYLAGSTVYSTAYSPSLPTTSNGYEPQVASGDLAPYLLKISLTGTSAPTVTLTVNPTSITVGQNATLTWSSTNATTCTASNAWSGAQATSGTQTVSPTQIGTNTYTLTCTGPGGSLIASTPLTVNNPPLPTVTLSVAPTSITLGQSATLTWSSTDATTCTASNAWSGTQAISGTQSVSPAQIGTNTYTLTCTGPGGSLIASTPLTVTNPPLPTVTLSVAPTSITLGQSATLTWSSTNATTCTAGNAWSGAKNTNGTFTVTPGATGTQTYGLTCSGAGSTSITADASVTVNAPAAASSPSQSGGGTLGVGTVLGLAFLLAWRSGRKLARSELDSRQLSSFRGLDRHHRYCSVAKRCIGAWVANDHVEILGLPPRRIGNDRNEQAHRVLAGRNGLDV